MNFIRISQDALEKIQVLLQETRRKIAEIASEAPESDRVFQLNMQLFPLSKVLPVKDREE